MIQLIYYNNVSKLQMCFVLFRMLIKYLMFLLAKLFMGREPKSVGVDRCDVITWRCEKFSCEIDALFLIYFVLLGQFLCS